MTSRWRGVVALMFVLCLTTCSEGPSALNTPEAGFTRAEHWEPLAPGVSEAPAEAALTAITLGPEPGYQAQHTIMTNDRSLLILRYDISISGGPAHLGVLASDRGAWIMNIPLQPDDRSVGEVYIPVTDESVFLVLQTMQDAAQPTVLTIRDVQYALE